MDTDLDVSHLFNLEQLLTGRFEHEYLEYGYLDDCKPTTYQLLKVQKWLTWRYISLKKPHGN